MANKKEKKQKSKILNYYYMLPEKIMVAELAECVDIPEEKKEIWTDLNILELVLTNDSLVLEDAMEDFDAEEDRAFLDQYQIHQSYAVSFDEQDQTAAMEILKKLVETKGGFLCSDTEDFQPFILGR